jgi:pimeloyl-ACP methyl ester carboxylesterase
MVLLEPNPIYLLKQNGRTAAYLEARDLRDYVKCFGALGEWDRVAERFADYWIGDGAWAAMPEKRRAAFVEALPPNFHEWDAAMDEQTTVEQLQALTCPTLVVSDPSTRRPIREIAELLEGACPRWSFRSIAEGGHMAPLTHPDVVNPIVRAFLDGAG